MIGGSRRGIQVLDPPPLLFFYYNYISWLHPISWLPPFFPSQNGWTHAWICLQLSPHIYLYCLSFVNDIHTNCNLTDPSNMKSYHGKWNKNFFPFFFLVVLTLYGNILSGNCHIYNEAEKQLHHCTLWGLLIFWIFKAWQHFIQNLAQ